MSELSSQAVAAALTTRRLGRPTLYFQSIGSTNDLAHARAAEGAPDGLLVLADVQTAGRGRLNRSWWAPPGGSLLMSLLLRPPLPLRLAGQLTMCLGLAAVEGIDAATGLRPALKWPNDLLWQGRKLGGMLTELRTTGERLEYAVLGLGINVNVTADSDFATTESVADHLPAELAPTATSLQIALGRPVARLELLTAIVARCESWYVRLLAGESLHDAWAARLDTLGRDVAINLASGARNGLAVGVTPEGALIVRWPEGCEEPVWAGDVTTIR